ncbi:MAG: hypothetical protein QMD97_00520 [Candidatus Aenigmarchaeota archaeon]|nr:hypothetical protein [Candidatus Aenigmarchaeota archaeon]
MTEGVTERKFSDYIVFDHRVHRYSLDEISKRLGPHVGKRMSYIQVYHSYMIELMGTLGKTKERFYLVNEMHETDLSDKLSYAKNITGEDALYTLLEIDSTTTGYSEAIKESGLTISASTK